MFQLIAWLVEHYYGLIPSYGAAISLLTLTVMVILTPLTLKSTRSIMQMQALQPEIKKLQVLHKDDRQKLNEEMMRFYKENNISPLGGCIPMLVQMPIYFILYRVLRQLTHRGGDGTFDPKYISKSSKLFHDLDGVRTMKSLGVDLATNASDVMSKSGIGKALPYFVLIVLVAVTTFVQQKQISGRNPGAQVNQMSQSMLKIMPVFMAFICLRLPGALVLYMFISNLYRVGQQQLISHTIYKPAQKAGLFDKVIEAKAADTAEPAQSKGFLQSLLGDAAPRVGKSADHGFKNGKDASNGKNPPVNGKNPPVNGKSPGGSKGAGSKAPASSKAVSSKSASPPKVSTPRSQSGRTTPSGSRPAGVNRTKKRR
jgi:YidC/Oxa1 family membrane protein insertase